MTRKFLNGIDAGSSKIINVANGSGAQDAAAYGQIPSALPPNGSASGDLSGSYPGPVVAQIQGVAVTSAEATLVSDLNNATARTATATLLPGEETIFSGSTASQTLTLPASPPSSSVNTATNAASVSVTLAPGAGATLSNFGTTGNITIPSGYTFAVVYIGTTWYVQAAGPSDFAKNNALAIANGGTGQATQQAAMDALAGAQTSGQFLRGNGTHVVVAAIQAGDLPAATTSAQGAVELDGTAGDIQNTGTQAAGNSTKAAAANHVHFSSGMLLCAPVSYAPSATSLTTTSATLAAVSSSNVNTGSFTAPASGNVIVTASFVHGASSASDTIAYALAAHGTVTPVVGNVVSGKTPNATELFMSIPFLVTGLTPGNSYNFDLLFAIASAGTATVYALGQSSTTPTGSTGGPVTMTVQAV